MATDNAMYPPLGPVEIGEWLRFEASDDWRHHFVQVSRLTKKLIWIDEGWDNDAPIAFSREHGAMFTPFMYDAYAGRLRKLTDEDRADPVYLAEVQKSKT